MKSTNDVVTTVLAAMKRTFESKSHVTGIPSGLKDLDSITGGFHAGELVVIGGRPSIGKTSLAVTLAINAAVVERRRVLFVTIGNGSDDILIRMLSNIVRIDSKRLRSARVQPEEWAPLAEATGKLVEAPLRFLDEERLTIGGLERALHDSHERGEAPDMVIIDYLQLLRVGVMSTDSRAVELGDVSADLKALAREWRVPIVAVSTLNRGPESRNNRRPLLVDIRDSGAIEDHADVILFLYSEEYYHKDRTPENRIGVVEIEVAKQRIGAPGVCDVRCINAFSYFGNLP